MRLMESPLEPSRRSSITALHRLGMVAPNQVEESDNLRHALSDPVEHKMAGAPQDTGPNRGNVAPHPSKDGPRITQQISAHCGPPRYSGPFWILSRKQVDLDVRAHASKSLQHLAG